MTLTQERRTNDRHTAWFPIRMDADESGGEVAIAKNVSDKGMLLASYKKLVVGEPVKLALHVRPEGDIPRLVSGTIVRLVPNDEDPEGMWRYKIAVEFDAPDPELVPSILDND
jgi:hypothetical protein